MDFTEKKISPALADLADRTFEIRSAQKAAELTASIRRTGIINAPYVMARKNSDRVRIVCGFKRIRTALDLGIKEITVRRIDGPAEEKDVFLLALHDDLAGVPLTPVETAGAVKGLLRYFSEETVIQEYLPLFGLAPLFDTLEELMLLAELDPEIKQGLTQGILAKKNAVHLADMGDSGVLLYRMFCAVNLSTSKQTEIIGNCEDIIRRDRTSIERLLGENEIRSVLSRDDLTRSQKGDRVRAVIRKKRFPRLTQLEEKFLKVRKALVLPKNIRFEPPPSFEGETFSLRIDLKNKKQLNGLPDVVKKFVDSAPVKALFETDGR